MLKFDIITLFPETVTPYLGASILGRAQKKRLVKISAHNLRRWTKDKHRTVDDRPFGGGAGMVMKVEPIFRTVKALQKSKIQNPKTKSIPKSKTRVVLMSASGKQFTERMAEQYAKKYDHIILICGRYEGVDARVAQYIADEEVSVGPYVLTGGELPALTIVDAVTRLIPGVIQKESLAEESFSFKEAPRRYAPRGAQSRSRGFAAGVIGEYPQYTRPEVFYPNPKNMRKGWRVPKILLTGDHKKIAAWRGAKLKHRDSF